MIKEFEWTAGAGSESKTAQVVGEELDRLQQKHNRLRPQNVVDEAQSNTSPIHKYFNWDDTKAANAYRLTQARNLINHIRVRIVDQRGVKSPPVRLLVQITDNNNESAYEPLVVAMKEPDKRRQIINRAISALVRARNEVESLQKIEASLDDRIKVLPITTLLDGLRAETAQPAN